MADIDTVTELPADRASLDSILRFLMEAPDAHLVLRGSYRLCDLIGDLAGTAVVVNLEGGCMECGVVGGHKPTCQGMAG